MSYKELKSYQGALIIYDFTAEFVKKYVDPKSRTTDQMVQAARSGKHPKEHFLAPEVYVLASQGRVFGARNIVEAATERTSKKSELKLLGVARASLQELLEDYEDFLRQRNLKLWEKDSAEAREVRGLVYRSDKTYRTYESYLAKPETAANAMICLINQVNFLLDRQITALKEKFLDEGGWTEQLFQERLRRRNKTNPPSSRLTSGLRRDEVSLTVSREAQRAKWDRSQ